jgi:hypothetical protein
MRKLKIRFKLIHWYMFKADAEMFYGKTGDHTYHKLARLAAIKIVTLRKQL